MSVIRNNPRKRPVKPTAVDGRILGDGAVLTRAALIDSLLEQILSGPWREVSITTAARQIERAPGTFYQYFHNIDDALDAVCARYPDPDAIPNRLARITHLVNADRPRGRKLPDPIAAELKALRHRVAELETRQLQAAGAPR